MGANSVKKFTYFCSYDFTEAEVVFTNIVNNLLQSRINFLMLPSLEILELKLRSRNLSIKLKGLF